MTTAIVTLDPGDVPEPTQAERDAAVDVLRKDTIRHLLALADEHNLSWFRGISANDYRTVGGQLYLELRTGDDDFDAHTAWAAALALTTEITWLVKMDDPFLSRRSSSHGWLSWGTVTLVTHLRPQRGLPEQGPRPTLPADPSCADCGVHVPGASADPWLRCPPCEAMTSVQRDLYLATLAQGRDPLAVLGMYEGRAETADILAVKRRLGLPDADREQIAAEDAAEVTTFRSDRDGATVVEIDSAGPTRVVLGEQVLFDGDPDAVAPAGPRSWSVGETIPADVDEVTDSAGYRAHRHGELWCYDNMPGRHSRAAQVTEPEMLRDHGPVTEAPAADEQAEDDTGMPEPCQPIGCDNGYHLPGCTYAAVDESAQEPSEIGRPDIVPGDEFADQDQAEIAAVRSEYVDEYGSEIVAERMGEL